MWQILQVLQAGCGGKPGRLEAIFKDKEQEAGEEVGECLSRQRVQLYKIPEVKEQSVIPPGCWVQPLGVWGQGSDPEQVILRSLDFMQ